MANARDEAEAAGKDRDERVLPATQKPKAAHPKACCDAAIAAKGATALTRPAAAAPRPPQPAAIHHEDGLRLAVFDLVSTMAASTSTAAYPIAPDPSAAVANHPSGT